MNLSDYTTDMNPLAATTIALLMGAVFFNPGQTSAAQENPTGVRSEMLVTTSWLAEHLKDSNLVILHVGRNRTDYEAGHIPGARYLPLDELVEQHSDSLNNLPSATALQNLFEGLGVGDGSRVILYGESGGLLAARAYFTLDYLGVADRVALLDGGMEKWKAEERATSHQEIHATPAHLTTHIQNEIVFTTSRIRQIADETAGHSSGDYVLLDARPPREFDGTVMSEAVPKAGHLPGAQSLYWKTLLNPDAIPTLMDKVKLREAFIRAGVSPQKIVIPYCRTGMQSSFDYFVAKYLGYRTAMYDGSVFEWVHRSGYDLVPSTLHSDKVSASR